MERSDTRRQDESSEKISRRRSRGAEPTTDAQSQRSELQHVKRLVVLAFQRIDTIEDEKKSLEEQVERLECRVDQLSSAACKSQRTQMQDDGRAETELQCVKGPMVSRQPHTQRTSSLSTC